MRSNGGNFSRDEWATAVRAGEGLLAELLRCGCCGRKLYIRYWGKRGTAARYLCDGEFSSGEQYCLGFGGATVRRRVSEEILQAISSLAVEASVVTAARLNDTDRDRCAALQRQLQQLDDETKLALA
jgi:hypothetical protein